MSDLRVGSGSLRGMKLQSPQSPLTHPMGAREKLAIFNMIDIYLAGARVADLYAGSGALGIEALSRGAKEVVFVEKSVSVKHTLESNIKQVAVKLANIKVKTILDSVQNFAALSEYQGYFNVLLVDPPYDKLRVEALEWLSGLLDVGGIMVLSYPHRVFLEPPVIKEMKILKKRVYASAGIGIYQKAIDK